MAMKVFTPDDARQLTWTYNPNGKTLEEQRGPGDDVRVLLYSMPEHNRLVGRVIMKPRAHHGKVPAKDTCYYYVLSGRVDFHIYCGGPDGGCQCGTVHNDQHNCCQEERLVDSHDLGPNQSVTIEKGTIFDYFACGDSGAEVMLFRDYA